MPGIRMMYSSVSFVALIALAAFTVSAQVDEPSRAGMDSVGLPSGVPRPKVVAITPNVQSSDQMANPNTAAVLASGITIPDDTSFFYGWVNANLQYNINPASLSGTPQSYATFSYELQGMNSEIESNSDSTMLQTLMGLIDNMISTAQTFQQTDSSGNKTSYLGWPYAPQSAAQEELDTYIACGEIAREECDLENHLCFRTAEICSICF